MGTIVLVAMTGAGLDIIPDDSENNDEPDKDTDDYKYRLERGHSFFCLIRCRLGYRWNCLRWQYGSGCLHECAVQWRSTLFTEFTFRSNLSAVRANGDNPFPQ